MMTMIMLAQHTTGITTNINIADHIGSIASDDALAIKKRRKKRRERGRKGGKEKVRERKWEVTREGVRKRGRQRNMHSSLINIIIAQLFPN